MRILCYLVLLLLSQHLMSVPLPLLLLVASRMVIKRQAGAGVMQQQQQVLSSATISQPWKEWSSKQQWNWLVMPISFKQCFAIMNHSVLWVKYLLALIISITIIHNRGESFDELQLHLDQLMIKRRIKLIKAIYVCLPLFPLWHIRLINSKQRSSTHLE